MWWEGPLGTVAVIGIATKRAAMQCQGYVALLGSDDQSWGWNLVDNNLLHNGEVNGSFPQCNNAPKYQVSGAWRWPAGPASLAPHSCLLNGACVPIRASLCHPCRR